MLLIVQPGRELLFVPSLGPKRRHKHCKAFNSVNDITRRATSFLFDPVMSLEGMDEVDNCEETSLQRYIPASYSAILHGTLLATGDVKARVSVLADS